MSSNLGPIAAALISWIVFNTIGKPLLRFFDLRTEVRRTMILYDNVRARWREHENVRVLAMGDEDMTQPTSTGFRKPKTNIGTWRRRFARSLTRNRRPALFSGGSASMYARLHPD
jgi:hypothetical protein